MADKMTLIDVRDWHRFSQQAAEAYGHDNAAGAHKELADALDAHIAAMGEPVAWLRNDAAVARPDLHVITTAIRDIWTKVNAQHVERYTIPLFRAPPASGDWDKVREAIIGLRRCQSKPEAMWIVDQLTAALPESQS